MFQIRIICPPRFVKQYFPKPTMEELITLRKYIEEKDYIKALELVEELEEMSKEDKLNKIYK
ncbi:MAG TPA: hypothetical protein ACFCUY_14675 [Xenococcaceae cyanobacterium]|jgi:hypothetical protein